jgi:hypothetical protein
MSVRRGARAATKNLSKSFGFRSNGNRFADITLIKFAFWSAKTFVNIYVSKGAQIMLKRIAKTTLFATIITSVLCAGAASARQLRTGSPAVTCGGACTTNADCASGCVCSRPHIIDGFCSTRPVPGQ